ncbi:hypothetical protein ABTN41_19255, partial [Acinetobacter baumannii]
MPAPITVTPRDLLPRTVKPEGAVGLPVAGALRPPAGAEALVVKVGGFAVEGGFAGMARETGAITAPLAGRTITLAEL